MYEIFNPLKEYFLPDGSQSSGENLEKDFPLCTSIPYAAVVEDGVLSELTRLSVLKDIYDIDEADSSAAITKINEEIHSRNNQRVFDQQAIETTQNAAGELGVMTATTMESTAELGATVAALEARIAALESAR